MRKGKVIPTKKIDKTSKFFCLLRNNKGNLKRENFYFCKIHPAGFVLIIVSINGEIVYNQTYLNSNVFHVFTA